MSTVFAVALGMLTLAGLLVLLRLMRGPSTLDRIVAVDVLVILMVAGVAVGVGISGRYPNIALLVVVALLGFAGSVTAVRLTEKREGHR
jgi:multicomponent Na+:H+ antiporter subunit F